MAFAIMYIASSSLVPFSEFIPHRMKRQFFWVYPAPGIIWSMLGEYGDRDFGRRSNSSPDISQNPVQRLAAHSWVRSKGRFRFLARTLAAFTIISQGEFCRVS